LPRKILEKFWKFQMASIECQILRAATSGTCHQMQQRIGLCVMAAAKDTTTPPEERHSISWGALFLWPFVILLLYVLSVGPLVMLSDKGAISPSKYSKLDKLYWPVLWLDRHTPLHKPFWMYLSLWSARFDENGNPPNPVPAPLPAKSQSGR
jgi:hypothetical protein